MYFVDWDHILDENHASTFQGFFTSSSSDLKMEAADFSEMFVPIY
jgi:hypothetical protein